MGWCTLGKSKDKKKSLNIFHATKQWRRVSYWNSDLCLKYANEQKYLENEWKFWQMVWVKTKRTVLYTEDIEHEMWGNDTKQQQHHHHHQLPQPAIALLFVYFVGFMPLNKFQSRKRELSTDDKCHWIRDWVLKRRNDPISCSFTPRK